MEDTFFLEKEGRVGELRLLDGRSVYYEGGTVYAPQVPGFGGRLERREPIGHYDDREIKSTALWNPTVAWVEGGAIYAPGEKSVNRVFAFPGARRQIGSLQHGHVYAYVTDLDGRVLESYGTTGNALAAYDVEDGAAAAAYFAGILPVPLNVLALQEARAEQAMAEKERAEQVRQQQALERASRHAAYEQDEEFSWWHLAWFILKLAFKLAPYLIVIGLLAAAGLAILWYPAVTFLAVGLGVGAITYFVFSQPLLWCGSALIGAGAGTLLGSVLMNIGGQSVGLAVIRVMSTLTAACLAVFTTLVVTRSVRVPLATFTAIVISGVLVMVGGSVYGLTSLRQVSTASPPVPVGVEADSVIPSTTEQDSAARPVPPVPVTDSGPAPSSTAPLQLVRPLTDPVAAGIPRLYDTATTLDGADSKGCALIDAGNRVKQCRVSVASDTRYAWGSAWCSATPAALTHFLQHATFSYALDGTPIRDAAFWEGRTPTCLKRRLILQRMPTGETHELKLTITLDQAVQDGKNVYPAGAYELVLNTAS